MYIMSNTKMILPKVMVKLNIGKHRYEAVFGSIVNMINFRRVVFADTNIYTTMTLIYTTMALNFPLQNLILLNDWMSTIHNRLEF